MCASRGTKRMYVAKTCPYLILTTIGLDWEEDTVQRSMMLNLMPIPHVLHMKEIIPTSRNVAGTCSPVDRMYVTAMPAIATSAMATSHIKTNSIGDQWSALID